MTVGSVVCVCEREGRRERREEGDVDSLCSLCVCVCVSLDFRDAQPL